MGGKSSKYYQYDENDSFICSYILYNEYLNYRYLNKFQILEKTRLIMNQIKNKKRIYKHTINILSNQYTSSKLKNILNKLNYDITEYDIREILQYIKEENIINVCNNILNMQTKLNNKIKKNIDKAITKYQYYMI